MVSTAWFKAHLHAFVGHGSELKGEAKISSGFLCGAFTLKIKVEK